MPEFERPLLTVHSNFGVWLKADDYLTVKGFRRYFFARDGTALTNELVAPAENSPTLDAYEDNYHRALSELWLLLDESIQNQVLSAKTGPSALWRALKSRFSVESAAIEIRRANNLLAECQKINLNEVKQFLGATFGAVATLSRHGQNYLISSLIVHLEKCLPEIFRSVLDSINVADTALTVADISMKLHQHLNSIELRNELSPAVDSGFVVRQHGSTPMNREFQSNNCRNCHTGHVTRHRSVEYLGQLVHEICGTRWS